MSVIWWPALCGNQSELDAFWSESLTWNSSTPDLSQCFQNSVLSVVPCVYLWLTCLVYIPHLCKRPTVNSITETSTFNIIKTVFCILLVITQVTLLTRNVVDHLRGEVLPLVQFLQPAILLPTYILSASLTHYEYRKGVHSEGVLFFFWLLLVLLDIVPFRSYILQYDPDMEPAVEDLWGFVIFFLTYTLQLALFISSLFSDIKALPWLRVQDLSPEEQPLLGKSSDKEPRYLKQEVSPELTSPFWQNMMFLWMSGLIIKGYKKTLDFKDMWPLPKSDTSEYIMPRVLNSWNNQVSKTGYRMMSKRQAVESSGEVFVGGKSPQSQLDVSRAWLEAGSVTSAQRKDPTEKLPSFWSVVMNTFGPYYMLGGLFYLLYTIISFISPILLNLLISFVGTEDPYVWRGYLYVVLLVVVCQVKSVFNQWYWHCCYVVGLRLRTAVIGIIYRKALKINNASRGKSTTGEIVNLMSVDAQKLQDIPGYLHLLWAAPLTVAIALYFLWQQLGPSVMAGFGLLLLLVPFNAFLAQKTRTLQIQQMRLKDQRLKVMNEVLNGIKVLKLYAWEKSFQARILKIREEELRVLKKSQYLNAGSAISWFMAPYLVALGSFATYTLSSPTNILDANKAFVSLSLFNIMNLPISMLPGVIAFGVQAGVSIGRINRFLRNQELDPDNVTEDVTSKSVISVKNGTFTWNKDEKPVLHGLDVRVEPGQLVAVVGLVGAGKSSLLSALLGEMEVLTGRVTRRGSLAYVPQQAWIQNSTLKENVLFGKPLSEHSYKKVIEACALLPDLQILPGGDQIEIGEKGINLSGGQKQRVSLARAVYQNTDTYLLDDPLSAVDAHVGKHIFEQVIGPTGLLRHKTRVLVTNGITFLPKTDSIICLKDGRVSEMGTYEDLLSNDGPFAEFITTYLKESSSEDEDKELTEMKSVLKKQISVLSWDGSKDVDLDTTRGDRSSQRSGSSKTSKKQRKRKVSVLTDKEKIERQEKRRKDQKLTEEEQTMVGRIKLSVITAWIKSCNPLAFTAMLLFYLVYVSSQAAGNIWLSQWSSDPPSVNGTQNIPLRNLRLGVYGGIGALQAIGTLGHSFMMAIACVSSSRLLHWQLLANILRAPTSFFDTTPLGRIINRFSKDVDTLDVNIPVTLRIWMGTMSVVLTTVFVICYSTPFFVVVVLPLGVFYFFIQRFYISTSRQLRRIDSVKRSPTYIHFSETLSGLSSVRAYKKTESFIQKCDQLVDDNQMAYYPNIVSNRWLGILLDVIGNLIVLFAGIFAVVQREDVGPGLAGLAVSYALQITGTLNVWVRMTSDLENYIVAVERIQEYADCPKEAPAVVEDNRPSRDWPSQGQLVFENYSTRYRPGLDLVLHNVSCEIRPGEMIGVVGRTGAGKSSLTLALFRIVEASLGHIVIDSVNIANIGLDDLRSRITIIPQDPVLFSGTLRMNLDPFDEYSDSEVWLSLKQAHLKTYVESLPAGLVHMCSEGGENLSVGQRQLVCLARALLRRTKILVLDEATAAVDLETDDLIQASIRTEFKESTVITIAHRLNTVLDYDRIMVLDKGHIIELDTPSSLLENKSGVFYSLASNAGLV